MLIEVSFNSDLFHILRPLTFQWFPTFNFNLYSQAIRYSKSELHRNPGYGDVTWLSYFRNIISLSNVLSQSKPSFIVHVQLVFMATTHLCSRFATVDILSSHTNISPCRFLRSDILDEFQFDFYVAYIFRIPLNNFESIKFNSIK